VRLRPQLAEIHVDLGVGLQEMEKIDEAIAEYEHALRLKPQLATAHYNLGLALMLRGICSAVLRSTRGGRRSKTSKDYFNRFPSRAGMEVKLPDDQRLLIHAEQGMGDTIQFVRYLPMVMQRAKK